MRTRMIFVLTATIAAAGVIALIAVPHTRSNRAVAHHTAIVGQYGVFANEINWSNGINGKSAKVSATPQPSPTTTDDFPADCPICSHRDKVKLVWQTGEPVGYDNKQYRCVVEFDFCGTQIYRKSPVYNTEDKGKSCDAFNKEAEKKVGTSVCCPEPACLTLADDVRHAYEDAGASFDTAFAAGQRAKKQCEQKRCEARQNPNRKQQPPEALVSCPDGTSRKCCDLFLAIVDAYKKAGASLDTMFDAADAALIECNKKSSTK